MMRYPKKRKSPDKWKRLTQEQRALIVQCLLDHMPRSEICKIIPCSISTVSEVRMRYCDVTKTVTLKKDAKSMAKYLESIRRLD